MNNEIPFRRMYYNGITLCATCYQQVHAELDTYTLSGKRLDEADFIHHIKQWKPNGSQ